MVLKRFYNLVRPTPPAGAGAGAGEVGEDAYSRRLSRVRGGARQIFSTPAGERLYAIGDIHGRDDLLRELLAMIDADNAGRRPARTSLVFLGDYVDRGPNSRGVVEALMALQASGRRAVFLMGNHEELLLLLAEGDRRAAGLFDQIGGRDTLLSYGVSEIEYEGTDSDSLPALIRRVVPMAHLDWLRTLLPSYRAGDFLFAHAGVRPGVPVEAQKITDLLWIRGPFLEYTGDHGLMIVHGHSITETVDIRDNRIGIDTGAFASGRLTALGIEGRRHWTIQTGGPAAQAIGA